MADFEERTVILPDGYEAYARYWPVDRPRAAVLYLHGIQSHCGWYERSAGRLQQAGFAVLQPDRRGSGRNQQQRGHAESHRQLISDGLACGQHLLEHSGLRRFHLVGVSWGGKLACAMAVANPAALASLSLVCPGLFPRVNVSSAEKFRIGLAMVGNRNRYFDIPLNDPHLFTSQPRWIDFLRRDELSLHQVTASFFLATRRMDPVLRELPSIQPLPLHVMVAGDDQIVDSTKTVEYFRRLEWPKVRITNYPDAKHTLEFEPLCEEYCDDLVEWMQIL
ncbi:MAG: alpha/beta fold hydrolase [Phycisphaeraceae bacterium]